MLLRAPWVAWGEQGRTRKKSSMSRFVGTWLLCRKPWPCSLKGTLTAPLQRVLSALTAPSEGRGALTGRANCLLARLGLGDAPWIGSWMRLGLLLGLLRGNRAGPSLAPFLGTLFCLMEKEILNCALYGEPWLRPLKGALIAPL